MNTNIKKRVEITLKEKQRMPEMFDRGASLKVAAQGFCVSKSTAKNIKDRRGKFIKLLCQMPNQLESLSDVITNLNEVRLMKKLRHFFISVAPRIFLFPVQ